MITLPSLIKKTEKDLNISVFEVEPLYPGYGTTLGNALRRVLLSSIEGAAITQVKIKGASNEFSIISGIKEDVLEIILNLKQVRLKIFSDEPQKVELKVSGKKDIKASDIKTPSQVEIVNKDLHIASLTTLNAKLEIEMTVEKGFGYATEDQIEKGKPEIGVIYLDASFTPIQRVAFEIENIRLEKRTDYNKLRIEVESDGTIKPEEAFKQALEILIVQFKTISEGLEEPKAKKGNSPKESKENINLEDLNISSKTLNVLEGAGIKNLKGLLRKKESDLAEIKGFGEKGIKEIKRKIKKAGFILSE